MSYQGRLYGELLSQHGSGLLAAYGCEPAWDPDRPYDLGDVVTVRVRVRRTLMGWLRGDPKHQRRRYICVGKRRACTRPGEWRERPTWEQF